MDISGRSPSISLGESLGKSRGEAWAGACGNCRAGLAAYLDPLV